MWYFWKILTVNIHRNCLSTLYPGSTLKLGQSLFCLTLGWGGVGQTWTKFILSNSVQIGARKKDFFNPFGYGGGLFPPPKRKQLNALNFAS